MLSQVFLWLDNAWVDVTSDVFAEPGLSYTGGIPSNKETDRVARYGTLSFVFKNNDAKYTPGSGTAHADWDKGTPIKVEFTEVVRRVKFVGRVNSIKLQYVYNNKRAAITALDWMYFASQLPLDIPALQTDKRADEIIETIIDLSPIQPETTDLQTGVATFPYAFHDNTVKTTAYSEITKAVLSEWGYSYVKQDGTFVFEKYGGRSATQKELYIVEDLGGRLLQENGDFLLLETGDKILLDNYNVVISEDAVADVIGDVEVEYGEQIINRVDARVYPYKAGDTDQLLYTNETNQLIPAGETVSFRVQFTDEASRQPISALPPSVKQYTLLHCDSPDDGISGVVDSAEPRIAGNTTAFSLGSGAGWNTSIKKFGTASLVFNGSSDYIYSASQEKFNPRAGDFTFDWWEYRTASTSGKATVSRDIAGGYSPFVFGYSDGTNLLAYITSNGSSWDIANGKTFGTLVLNTWTHYAIMRVGNTFFTTKNGAIQDLWTSSGTILPSTADLSIFRYGSAYTSGYIDEVRMIKGYAAWTDSFTPETKQYSLSGINWSAYTTPPKSGTEITPSVTVTIGAGGVGLDITAANASGSDGYLNLDIYGAPLQSLSSISSVVENTTSVNAYGYFGENIDMRLRQDIVFAETVASGIVTAEKDPRMVMNKISMVANKNTANAFLFLECDFGDLIRVTESLSGYDELVHIQGGSWRAVPGDDGSVVYFDWTIKEQ